MTSAHLLVRMEDRDVAMFRFLLEAHENLAFFTVLERKPALLKLSFCSESRADVLAALSDIKRSVALEYRDWPQFGALHGRAAE